MLQQPTGVTVTSDGSIWVSDGAAGRVIRLDDSGELDSFEVPEPVAIAPAGTGLVVAGAQGVSWIGPERTRRVLHDGHARGVAFDPETEQLYMSLEDGVHTLVAGALSRLVEVLGARGLALSADRRRLYAAAGDRVLELTRDGATEVVAAELQRCCDVAITAAGVAAVDRAQRSLLGINPRHRTTTCIWAGDNEPGLGDPVAVDFERSTRSYLVADGGGRLLRVARDGGSVARVA
jgi:sugar lactone lactonase YvrE